MNYVNRQLIFFIVTALTLTFAAAAAAQPVITGINKTEAPRSGRVAITGSGFGTSGDVFIGGLTAWTSTWSDTRVVAYVPEAAPLGVAPLSITVQGQPSNEESLTVTARQANGRVRWAFEADGSNLWWRPALAPNGNIYLHTNNTTEGIIYALSSDGGLLWVQKVNWNPYVPPSAGPDGALYVGSGDRVYRISPQGNIDWEYWDGVSRGPRVAPTIGPDGLLYGAFEGGIGAFAMEPLTGQVVWSNPGTPLLSDKSGEAVEMKFGPSGPNQPVDQLYISMDGGAGFYAFSLTGDQLFTASFGNLSGTAEVAIGSDGTIYGPRAIGLVVAAVDPSDGSTLWEYFPGPSEWATGTNNVEIGPDDMLYFVGSSAKLEAFDPATQSRKWQHFTVLDTLKRPSVTPDGSTLIATGADNDFFGNPGFVKAFNSKNGKELWRFDLPFQLGPGFRVYGVHHPRITPDSTTAYVSTLTLAEWPLNQDPHSFLYALDLADGGPPPQNQAPTAVATATPTSGTAPLTVSFDASGSTDPDGVITTYAWTFGDGSSSTAPNPGHTYANPGTYGATLTVTDDKGATGSDSLTITAGSGPVNQAPIAAATATPTTGDAPLTVSFDGSGSSDPDGVITAYAWTFGDGTTGTGANPGHTYGTAGTYVATLTVTDDGGATDSASVTLTVTTPTGPPATTFRLRAKIKPGWGTLTSVPAGINCPGDCNENYAEGTTVTVTVTPAPGLQLKGWKGDCEETPVTQSCVLQMTKKRTVEIEMK